MERDLLVTDLRRALTTACPGSSVSLRGSLAAGTADQYSDIDLAWTVPDLAAAVRLAPAAVGAVQPVMSVRIDPDFRADQRLLFFLFEDLPLFWRLDLDIHGPASSVVPDAAWSLPASALANAVGAIKALRRDRPEQAGDLLIRAFQRLGERTDLTGDWTADITRLCRAAVAQEPGLHHQASRTIRACTVK